MAYKSSRRKFFFIEAWSRGHCAIEDLILHRGPGTILQDSDNQCCATSKWCSFLEFAMKDSESLERSQMPFLSLVYSKNDNYGLTLYVLFKMTKKQNMIRSRTWHPFLRMHLSQLSLNKGEMQIVGFVAWGQYLNLDIFLRECSLFNVVTAFFSTSSFPITRLPYGQREVGPSRKSYSQSGNWCFFATLFNGIADAALFAKIWSRILPGNGHDWKLMKTWMYSLSVFLTSMGTRNLWESTIPASLHMQKMQ